MKVTTFAKKLTELEGLKKQVNIAQMMEILRCLKKLLHPVGIDLYKLINNIK